MAGIRKRGRGELEAAILRVLRSAPSPLNVNQIREAIPDETPAGTTVLTTLDRMYAKGEVLRLQDSPRKVRFAAVHSEAESASATMHRALEANEDRQAVLLKFAGDLSEQDAALLRSALRDDGD